MKTKSIAIIQSQLPFYNSSNKDALDLALIYGSFDFAPSLFFEADACWLLVKNHHAEQLGLKNYLANYKALPFYDVDNLYVRGSDLAALNIQQADISNIPITILSDDEYNAKLHQHQVIYRF